MEQEPGVIRGVLFKLIYYISVTCYGALDDAFILEDIKSLQMVSCERRRLVLTAQRLGACSVQLMNLWMLMQRDLLISHSV